MKGSLFLFVLLGFCVLFAYFIFNGAGQLNQLNAEAPVRYTGRIYENYGGNTVAKPTWNEDADQMALVNVKSIPPYYIDKFEATISQGRAWSVPGLTPTTKLTSRDAKDACAAAGKRLCTTTEWRVACRDGRTKPVYFKNTRALAKQCDWARSSGYDDKDYAGKNNSHPACATPNLDIHHIIGNVAEMTQGPQGKTRIVGMTYLGIKYYGAGFKDPDRALQQSCEYTVMDHYPDGRHNEGMGFRCCKSAR